MRGGGPTECCISGTAIRFRRSLGGASRRYCERLMLLFGVGTVELFQAYPKNDAPVSFEGHDVVPVAFNAICDAWNQVN